MKLNTKFSKEQVQRLRNIINGIQTKTRLKFELNTIKMTITKDTNDNKYWFRSRKKSLYTVGGNVN